MTIPGKAAAGRVRNIGLWLRCRWRAAVVLVVLALPSALVASRTPILWKDIDALIQVAWRPGVSTCVHFPPLYCFSARVPLFVGARAGGETRRSFIRLIRKPVVTEWGAACWLVPSML